MVAGLAALTLAGCSGSSSGGKTQGTPDGENTAPAVKSETFHQISAKANSYLGNLAIMRGVTSEVYYPDSHSLTVTFKPTADKTDQGNVEDIVRQAKEKAAAKAKKKR